jgi:predicted O-linked N-acetylglucosamine transferase (SPINDLY family)
MQDGDTDLIADSEQEYVDIAVGTGTDPEARARKGIEQSSGVLFEDDQEVRDLEAALEQALAG